MTEIPCYESEFPEFCRVLVVARLTLASNAGAERFSVAKYKPPWEFARLSWEESYHEERNPEQYPHSASELESSFLKCAVVILDNLDHVDLGNLQMPQLAPPTPITDFPKMMSCDDFMHAMNRANYLLSL